jgi:hypothetical protein
MQRRYIIIALLLSIFFLLLLGLWAMRPALASFVRHRTEGILQEHFASSVQFADFQVSFTAGLHVTVSQLVLRYHGRQDIPPLIQIAQLSIALRPLNIVRPRPHIATVRLAGLQITLPPRELATPPMLRAGDLRDKSPIVIDFLQTDNAKITLLRGQSAKAPLEFLLHHLELTNINFENPAKFTATLTNAVPKGEIEVGGVFGPWNGETPRNTFVQAQYHLRNANLATINGLQGTLSSVGTFSGPLDYLAVKGSTETPDFTLGSVGNPIALHTDFVAVVDGTNGNTYLQSVVARFLRSSLVVTGEVVDLNRDVPSRTVNLDTYSENARVEDLIRLAVKTEEPVLIGLTRLQAKIRIPEEDVDLSQRLEVSSEFRVDDGTFTKPAIQERIDSLSRKGQGQPKNDEIAQVQCELTGAMHLEKGVIHFSGLRFSVPGAKVNLRGSYTLVGGKVDFHGNLFLDAKLSQTTTGPKALLLKALDPFFADRSGGSRLPIKIVGTSAHPQFGLDRGHNDRVASHATQTSP